MRIFSLTLAIASLALCGTAQEFLLPLGFATNAGSPTDDVPVARLKDNNLNGSITPGVEMASFQNWFGSAANTRTGYASPVNFMTDGVWVVENNEPAFYFTDTEEGRVIRCVDGNHNGFIDATEWTVFFNFGLSTTTSPTTNGNGLFAPDSVAAWRDTVNNRTIVYAAIDNGSASTRGFTHGIYRLIDQNGNGTAMDTGVDYAAPFVNSTMGLTVPGRTGPVAITRDFWTKIRVAPGGKLLAYASGAMLSPPYTVQPEMNAWYGFTDNNGTAVPEVWLNMSSLNDLPMHPDFSDPRVPSTGLFPNMDIQEPAGVLRRMHFGGFLGIAPGAAPSGHNVYIVACSYNSGPGFFDTNLNNQLVAGLFYRVIDFNGNQRIDPGELSLYCNISNSTYNNVAPISFVNPTTFVTHNQLTGRQWGFDVAPDGTAGLSYVFSSSNTGFLTFRDNNLDFVIDASELSVPVSFQQTGLSPYPFDQQLGPFLASNPMLPDGLMPGPFATTAAPGNGTAGITPLGDGCVLPANHLRVLMDTWHGNPQVGNASFMLGAIRVPAGQPAFLVADFTARATPLSLAPFGLAAGCFGYLQNPTTIGFASADAKGRAMLPVPIPATTSLSGLNVFFQCAVLDLTLPQPPVPFYTTNALQVTVQP